MLCAHARQTCTYPARSVCGGRVAVAAQGSLNITISGGAEDEAELRADLPDDGERC